MARLLHHIITPPGECSYLGDRQSVTESRVMLDVTPAEMDALLQRGWRRFGPTYFRPRCQGCQECVSLRIPVNTFVPTASQRRAWKKCAHIRLEVGVPKVTPERLALYHAWHEAREAARGWSQDTVDEEQYALQFCFPHPCARELTYHLGTQLVAVGMVDETPSALSSVYFYFHPQVAGLSLGTASVLHEVELARSRGLSHLYMGYRVKDCPSLVYKGAFGPHELLLGRPDPTQVPQWVSPAQHPSMQEPQE